MSEGQGRRERFDVLMTVGQWQVIDGTLDSQVSIDSEDGSMTSARLGSNVREAGWRQLGWIPGARTDWPPPEESMIVSLHGTQWRLVCEVLERWAAVSDHIGQSEEAAAQREIRTLVLAQLAEQDFSPTR
jgi:hypothetical protein